MGKHERRINFTTEFAGITTALLAPQAPDTPPNEVFNFHALGAEFTGARGAFADRIAGWRQEGGLYREIAVKGRVNAYGKEIRNPYKTTMLAMPFNELEGPGRQTLLIFPSGDSFDYRVIEPQQSNSPDKQRKALDNEEFAQGFDIMFSPRDDNEPYIHSGWQIGFETTPLESFDKNISRFPLRVIRVQETDKEKILAQAEAAARNIKAKRNPQHQAQTEPGQ